MRKLNLILLLLLAALQFCTAQGTSKSLLTGITTLTPGGLDADQYEIVLTPDSKNIKEIIIKKSRNKADDDSNKNRHNSNLGSLGNTINIKSNRGRVRLEAQLEMSGISANEEASMFCQLVNRNKQVVAFDNMSNYKTRIDAKNPTYLIELNYDNPITAIGFGFYVKGIGELKVKNIVLKLDSGEFDKDWSTRYVEGFYNDARNVKALATLCKVWGFLKYHHPAITSRNLDWDSVLVNTLPGFIANGRYSNKKYYNTVLDKLINSLGQMKPCDNCLNEFPDSLLINYDMAWLAKNDFIDEQNLLLLNSIMANTPATPNKYVSLSSGNGTPLFDGEAIYKSMSLPNVNYRLLTLFRFWNIVHYFYPYKYAIGENWNNVLDRFIPIFIKAKTTLEYYGAVAKLIASIHDSHSHDFDLLRGSAISSNKGRFKLPIQLKIYNKKIIVTAVDSIFSLKTGLRRGTEIKEINSNSLKDFYDLYDPYISASNEYFKMEVLSNVIPFIPDSAVAITYLNNDAVQIVKTTVSWDMHRRFQKRVPDIGHPSYKLLTDSVAYINPGKMLKKDADTLCTRVVRDRSIKGVVIDCRELQREFLIGISQYFIDKRTAYARFNVLNIHRPGLLLPPAMPYMNSNQYNYKGPIVVLADALTISKNELFIMALQTNPRVKIIGNYTAGADGELTKIPLAGNIFAYFSGTRVTYPDGRETQRIGIKPDIFIEPSSDDIRMGKDRLLEEAIRYIKKQLN